MKVAVAVIAFAAASAATPSARVEDVEIVAIDYAFKVPQELAPGRTSFRLVNQGKMRHEFNVALLKPGATVQELNAVINARQPLASIIEASVGVLFASPGEHSPSALITELLPGRLYVVHCVLRDNRTAPQHDELGMYTVIHIGSGKPAAAEPIVVDTIFAADYAYRYARALAPGTHYFAFVNQGTQRHEVNIRLLKTSVTLEQLLKLPRSEPIRRYVDQTLGVLASSGGKAPIGLLRFDLLPGRDYAFLCGFSDSAGAPLHYELGMFGSIHVSGAAAPH